MKATEKHSTLKANALYPVCLFGLIGKCGSILTAPLLSLYSVAVVINCSVVINRSLGNSI